jgi:hypothetical protein
MSLAGKSLVPELPFKRNSRENSQTEKIIRVENQKVQRGTSRRIYYK